MALRIVPPKHHLSSTAPLQSAPSAPGVHDTLRAGLSEASIHSQTTGPQQQSSASRLAELQSGHALEPRLRNWAATRESMQHETLRRTFGIAEPVKRAMELRLVRAGDWRPAALGMLPGGGMSVHEDVLTGRDTEIGWEDVFSAGDEFRERPSMFAEMVRSAKLGW